MSDVDVIQQFERRVDNTAAAYGITRPAAIRRVVQLDPALHRSYLDAYNAKAAQRMASAPIRPGEHRTRWDALVAKHREAGLDPTAAVRAANKESPGLRQLMLDEVNAHAQRRR